MKQRSPTEDDVVQGAWAVLLIAVLAAPGILYLCIKWLIEN